MTWSYKPDYDRMTPNILVSMNGLVPTSRGGWRPMHSAATVWSGGAAGSTNVRYAGSFLAVNSSGAARVFLASSATGPVGKIWEATSTSTLTDRSKGGSYTNPAASYVAHFSFCQLGDTTIAANKSDALQSSTTGAFADTAGTPPKAKFCVADQNQVVLLNYNDGTDTPDGWWCSDTGTTTTWTPASANEAKNGRLRDSGGAITAACAAPFGGVMAFKKNACYIGSYVGQPKVREWRLVSPRIGCPYPEAAISVEDVVYFVGDDCYRYDGSRPVSVTEGIRTDFRTAMATYPRVALQYDPVNAVLYVMLGADTNANFAGYFALNIKTGEWGTGGLYDKIIGCLGSAPEEAATWNSNLRAGPAIWISDASSPAYVSLLSTLSGIVPADSASADITWQTSYYGNALKATTVTGITPIFVHGAFQNTNNANGVPADRTAYSCSVTSYKRVPGGGQSSSTGNVVMSAEGKFDLMAQGNWHVASYSVDLNNVLTESFEWFDHIPEYQGAGKL